MYREMKTRLLSLLIAPLVCIFVSCDDFLSKVPDTQYDVDIDSEEKIAELLTGAYPEASYFTFLEARTDNVEERVRGQHTRLNEAMYFWEDYDYEDLDTPLSYWNECYRGIAQVNQALELLAKYPKTERIKALYGEAFLLRAYLHFMLVNIWSEPYSPAKSETDLGIPYLTRPEKNDLVTYGRGTVAEVYRLIEKDLRWGLSLIDDSYYQHPKYHFNKKAAHAFATRFYLMKGEWKQVVEYADLVLGYDPSHVLRKWVDVSYAGETFSLIYTNPQRAGNLLLTTVESRIARELPTQKYGLTFKKAKEIFNRKGIDIHPDYKLTLMTLYPLVRTKGEITDGLYISKFDEYSRFGNGGSKPRNLYVTNVLLTADEVMLNRSEAYAMLGQYDLAINDLVDFLRIKYNVDPFPYFAYRETYSKYYRTYSPFYGMTKEQLSIVKLLCDLRQREFVHEGLRWFDIRRFYMPVTRSSGSRVYSPLEKDDYRKVLQIPIEAIKSGLEPNPRNEKLVDDPFIQDSRIKDKIKNNYEAQN